MPAVFLCLDPAIVPAGSRQSVGPMSYRRFAEMAVALCFGLTFALVGWWEVAGPIWRVRVDRIRRTVAGRRFGNAYRLRNSRRRSRRSLWCS